MANTSLAQPGGLCGPAVNAKCSDKQCCSSSHYCGVTTGHCVGANCLAGWGRCGPAFVQGNDVPALPHDSKPSNDAREAAPGGACGPTHNAICPGMQCCSVYSYCGVQPDHCAPSNCTKSWGHCWADKPTPSPAPSPTPSPGPEPTTAGNAAAAQGGKPGMPLDRIAIIVCSLLGGVSAIVAVTYTVEVAPQTQSSQGQQFLLTPPLRAITKPSPAHPRQR
uniref:Chitin-binding type-1 domain-containing protein n=1 Tax=Tetradesmus obliquus TaxID=3088 RepID=A0A383VY79_TETOB|eukprot:jgi/Sobl393_1/12193/SZX69819.1